MICEFWHEVLPTVIEDLQPIHRDIIITLMNVPGKRRRVTYKHALTTWNLEKSAFDDELAAALQAVRDGLKRRGIYFYGDLEVI